MATTTSILTVLDGLPTFAGNPRESDVPFKPEIDAKTFIESLENYFIQNNIHEDDKKITILFAMVDKIKGDAIQLITCLAESRHVISSSQVNCNESGHLRRDCQTCGYCRKYGHTAKRCEDRIKNSKGKYCHECKLEDSHITNECYKSSRRPQPKSRNKNIRMIVEEGEDTENSHEGTWSSNVYESSDDDTDGRDPNNL